jgi:hypothetical protein
MKRTKKLMQLRETNKEKIIEKQHRLWKAYIGVHDEPLQLYSSIIYIANVVYNVLSSREIRNERFKHMVQVQLNVKTAYFWESARGYTWKHLRSDSWTRGNGTRMTLVRIHQKTPSN